MTKNKIIPDFNPSTDLVNISWTKLEKKDRFEEYKEKYVDMVLNIVSLKKHIYDILEDIDYHEIEELESIIEKESKTDYIKKEWKLFIEKLKGNIEKAERYKKSSSPEEFIKIFFGKEDLELKWKIKRKIINWATVIEFEKKGDYNKYTWHSDTLWLSYYNKAIIIIKWFNKEVYLEHELSHYYNSLFTQNIQNKKQHHKNKKIFDEILARSLKMRFTETELETQILHSESSYLKWRDIDYEIEKWRKNYKKILELKEKYPKDFQKILLLTNLKRIDYFL